jgi:ssDNA-binding Zn-finger/Zn-ribbon topoisomerase 1
MTFWFEQSDDDIPGFDPEDCEEYGLEAGQFGDEDYENGAWKCPECGAVQ